MSTLNSTVYQTPLAVSDLWVINTFKSLTLQCRQTQMVWNGPSSHKKTFIGSKVKPILLNGIIFPFGAVAMGMDCGQRG